MSMGSVRRGALGAPEARPERRTRSFPWLLALPLAVGCSGAAAGLSGASPASTETSCPYTTAEQWQGFLERQASDPRWVETCEDQTCDDEYYRLVERDVQGVFDRCAGFLASHPSIHQCTKNLRELTPTFLQQHSPDTYGFTVDNHTYLTAQEADDKPSGMMAPPPALLAAFPLRKNVEAAARKNGWKYITHDSALGGVRTFVFIPDPDGKFDQWMLLNFVQKDQPGIDPALPMSFIAVQKKDRSGNDLPRVRLHFRDYSTVPASGGYRLELAEDRNGKCYACHASGMRLLIPRRTPVLEAAPVAGEKGIDGSRAAKADFAFGRLQELNTRIRSYGLPDWEGQIVPQHHGPALGAAQGCTGCHDGETRGILTVSTSMHQVQQKVYAELAMPPAPGLVALLERGETKSPALSGEEKTTLGAARAAHAKMSEAFAASRLPELRRWLLEAPCK